MPSLTAPLLASLAAAVLFLAFAHLLIKRRRETDRLAAARIAALQEKIGAALQDGFDQAAPPGEAKALYEHFLSLCREKELTVAVGEFQAEMLVALENDGPVTILLDSRKLF